MNARRAARELAIIIYSQLLKNKHDLQNKDLQALILESIRTLTKNEENELKQSIVEVFKIKEFIENYEFEHPNNLKKPIGSKLIPVSIPLTSDMIGRIDTILNAADRALSAIEIAEFNALSEKQEVKDYVLKLINTYKENRKTINEQIDKYSKGWNIERLIRIDRHILRIAVTEMFFFDDIPTRVSIDEAVELAKKYSSEESSSFINGILRKIVDGNKLPEQQTLRGKRGV